MRKVFLSLAVLSLAALGWPAAVLATSAPAAAGTGSHLRAQRPTAQDV